jgi:hypothetical protein
MLSSASLRLCESKILKRFKGKMLSTRLRTLDPDAYLINNYPLLLKSQIQTQFINQKVPNVRDFSHKCGIIPHMRDYACTFRSSSYNSMIFFCISRSSISRS